METARIRHGAIRHPPPLSPQAEETWLREILAMPGVAWNPDHRPQTILARYFGVERFEF